MNPLRPGDPTQLGVHRVLGRLGEGAQGVVYLAEGPGGTRVAIKLLHQNLVGDAEARSRFLREVSSAKRVARFSTAQILAADAAGERPYIVSEYVPGPSLHRLVQEEGPRDEAALERLAIGTATALAGIHKAGVVHRDLKPHNVLIGPDGPRVIDFGVARALDASATTMTAGVVGTPAYMAPEQLAGQPVGPAADIFAWGVTMVFAATGRPAFGNDTIPAVMHRILHEQPDLTRLPRPLRDLVAASLAKDPADRPSAQRLLLTLVGHEDPPVPVSPGRRWVLPAAAVAVAAAVAIAVIAFVFQGGDGSVAASEPTPSSRITQAPTVRRTPPQVAHRPPAAKPKTRAAGGRACGAARPVFRGKARGQYCALPGGGTAVYARPNGGSAIVGRLVKGGVTNWFVGQTTGSRFQAGAHWNTHWAYTLTDGNPGRWGWVPIVFFRGGGNGVADQTLTPCATRCHPY